MPAVTNKPVGSPIWIELSSTDPAESARFYLALLGLTSTEPARELGGYRNMLLRNAMISGLMPAQPGASSAWMVYLLVENVDETLDRVVSAGGRVLMVADDVADLGRFAFVEDPSSAIVGLWQPGSHTGVAVENEHGAPCWYELHTTTAFAETVAFYERAFGWGTTVMGDSDDFRMVTFGEGPDAQAGIYDATSASGPVASTTPASAWHVYFAVDDADAASATIRDEGGRLLSGPRDSPFGRMAHAVDSTGAAVTVIQLPAR